MILRNVLSQFFIVKCFSKSLLVLRGKGFSIHFLQEMHSSEKSAPFWLAEWGYKALFNSCNSANAGLAILITTIFPLNWNDPSHTLKAGSLYMISN